MKAALHSVSISLLLTGLLMAGGGLGNAEDPGLTQAVELYRKGNYLAAEQALGAIHQNHPEDSITTYYLAMTQAQLGRFDQARQLYNSVILLDPNGKTAELARDGLKYLPEVTADNLDLPPRFSRPEQAASQPAGAQAAQPGMSPQDMMMMQMMMGGQGNQGGGMGGFNPMMFGMMGQQPGDPNNPEGGGGMFGNMDPNVMSTMMMNQMLQNFNMMGDDSNKD